MIRLILLLIEMVFAILSIIMGKKGHITSMWALTIICWVICGIIILK